jgi:hypothetical protein
MIILHPHAVALGISGLHTISHLNGTFKQHASAVTRPPNLPSASDDVTFHPKLIAKISSSNLNCSLQALCSVSAS